MNRFYLLLPIMMASQGYREAGYEYLVIDDCWSLRERGKDGP